MEVYDEFGNLTTDEFGNVLTVVTDEFDNMVTDKFGNLVTTYRPSESSKSSESLKVDTQESELNFISKPHLMRNVCFVGQTAHGKTIFVDNLIEESLKIPGVDDMGRAIRYTDTRDDEKYRKMSIRSTPISLVLEDLTGNSYLINIIDVPGHLDFSDEMTSSLRLTDGAVLVVDASQGVLVRSRKAITHAIQEHLPIVVVINKVDHLFSAFRMTPEEAYKHLEQLISSINDHITAEEGGPHVNPLTGNICFSSALFGISFTLSSFAKKHVANFGLKCDALEFASHLWGDSYYDADKKAFMKEPPAVGRERCFVQYILEPFNRLRTQVLENDQDNLKKTLFEFGVRLPDETLIIKRFEDYHLLMRLAFSSVFGKVTGFTDMVVHHIPSVKEAASRKVNRIYRGCKKSLIKSMCYCDKAGPLMVDITKLYPTSDCSGSYALGRVYSGVIRKGQAVCVLTEDFEDEGDMAEVTNIWLYQACYRVPIIEASPGSLVVIEGVSDGIEKSATLCDEKAFDFFIPPQFNTPSVLKVVFEASNPFELAAVLTQLCKTFPLATVKRIKYYGGIEIQGPGKLYLDSIIKDLRIYSKVKIKILHWAVLYRETVLESSEKCFSTTKNKCTIAMIAEPLDESAEDLPDKCSIWANGPHEDPNILLDCTLPAEVDKIKMNSVKDEIVRSFYTALKNGPLDGQPIRQVKFSIVDAAFPPESSDAPYSLSIYDLIHSTLLHATPHLMEAIFYVEIQTFEKYLPNIERFLSREHGYITANEARQITTARLVKAFLPARGLIDFDDGRLLGTKNQAIACCLFSHWAVVPSHPKSVVGREWFVA